MSWDQHQLSLFLFLVLEQKSCSEMEMRLRVRGLKKHEQVSSYERCHSGFRPQYEWPSFRLPKHSHQKHFAARSHSSVYIPDLGAYSPQISHEQQQGPLSNDTRQGRKQPCKGRLPSMRLFTAVLTSRASPPGSLDLPRLLRQLDHSLHTAAPPLGHTTRQRSLLGFKTSISSETALFTLIHGKVRHILYCSCRRCAAEQPSLMAPKSS